MIILEIILNHRNGSCRRKCFQRRLPLIPSTGDGISGPMSFLGLSISGTRSPLGVGTQAVNN